jgi:tellurite resistance protein TerC
MFVRKGKKIYATVFFLVFLMIGTTDILFAVDSIPAIMGISQNPFVVITSNVFAVLGLTSLFFALKGFMGMFYYLKHGVSFILFFIGLKMVAGIYKPVEEWFGERSWVSLVVILTTLVITILLSLGKPSKETRQ